MKVWEVMKRLLGFSVERPPLPPAVEDDAQLTEARRRIEALDLRLETHIRQPRHVRPTNKGH